MDSQRVVTTAYTTCTAIVHTEGSNFSHASTLFSHDRSLEKHNPEVITFDNGVPKHHVSRDHCVRTIIAT